MVQLVFFFEIVIGTRHMAHDFVNLSLQTAGIYHDRAWIQEVLLMGVALCSLFVVVQLWRWLSHDGARDMPEKIAVVCTAFTLLIFSVETISLHGIDRLLYRPVGPVLFVACLWGAAAVGVFLPALWAARRANRLILVASRSPG